MVIFYCHSKLYVFQSYTGPLSCNVSYTDSIIIFSDYLGFECYWYNKLTIKGNTVAMVEVRKLWWNVLHWKWADGILARNQITVAPKLIMC